MTDKNDDVNLRQVLRGDTPDMSAERLSALEGRIMSAIQPDPLALADPVRADIAEAQGWSWMPMAKEGFVVASGVAAIFIGIIWATKPMQALHGDGFAALYSLSGFGGL